MPKTKSLIEFVVEPEPETETKTENGYISPCEMYAAVPYGNQFVIIHNGYQIRTCRNLTTAKNFIAQERKKVK